jgi:hypothetical protein
VAVLDETRRLAADLGRFLDDLLVEAGVSHADSPRRGGLRSARAQTARRERLERYIAAMSDAQRLRLAGALHLLSRRLDEELAHPDFRASAA